MKHKTSCLNPDRIHDADGYVALASVLVVAAIVIVVGMSSSLLAINEIQSSLAGMKNEETVDFVEGCVEDALLRLNNYGTIPTQITLPEGTCEVTINDQTGGLWIFTVSGTLATHTKSIQVRASRDTSLTVTSWQEN